jgi:hypothetical protein
MSTNVNARHVQEMIMLLIYCDILMVKLLMTIRRHLNVDTLNDTSINDLNFIPKVMGDVTLYILLTLVVHGEYNYHHMM